MKAIRIHETGGPEKLVYEEIPAPVPGPGQALVRIRAIGVNFIDIYFRTGLYKASLPFTPGMEAAGVIEAVGENVTGIAPGARVAYAMNPGSYAEYALANAWQLVALPEKISYETGAAAMLQGMTAHYLSRSAFPLQPGQTALIHAAAGGVGLLLIQMARIIGARIIGTVSTEEKEQLARAAGADHVIRYDMCDFESAVKNITRGGGVDVIYDSVGRATFEKGLNCLRRRGTIVLYGQSSGPVPPIDLNILNSKGSVYVTRPSLAHYAATPEELYLRAGDVLEWISAGKLNLRIDGIFTLAEAAEAHRSLEERRTKGKLLLLP
jgi:NADPH2:quinone reductase